MNTSLFQSSHVPHSTDLPLSIRPRLTPAPASFAAALVKYTASALACYIAVACLASGTAARADDATVGGDARVYGMGGAGLALMYGGGQRMNPASLAFERGPFSIAVPSVSVRTGGLSATKVENATKGNDPGSAGDLLRQIGSQDTNIGLTTDFSLRISKFEIASFGAVSGRLEPNASLSAFLRANAGAIVGNGDGGNPNAPQAPADARADLIAAGYYALPSVSAGITLPVPEGTRYNYGVGLRVKEMRGVFAHYYADANVLNGGDNSDDSSGDNNGDALKAPEMNGNNELTKNGVAADVGFFARPRTGQGFAYAALINNLVNPGLSFDGTDALGNPHTYKLLATTFSGGVAFQFHATALAADIVDITSASAKRDLRVGGEQRFLNLLSLRGGYSSVNGFTVGAGLWGLGVAYGKHLPLEVTQNLKF